MFRKSILPAAAIFLAAISFGQVMAGSPRISFQLSSEQSLGNFGGIPFCVDLDADGDSDILWLQWSGFFSSDVYDATNWKDRISPAEKKLFCLTATDAQGNILWQIGKPWQEKHPFISHGGERGLDCADIDGDGMLEIVCPRFDELLVIDAGTGKIERSVKTETDNARAICIGHTGTEPTDWTILAKNTERPYEPHEYANPVWFYDGNLNLLKTADYHGAGHCPMAADVDADGLDEFLIGFNLVDNDLKTLWTFQSVPKEKWDAAEMHVDDLTLGRVGGKLCVAVAASDIAYLLDATDGHCIWKHKGVHPQHCQIGRFYPTSSGNDIFIHNKRADLQLFDADGNQLWQMMPPVHFPRGRAAACKGRKFHMFDPTSVLEGFGPANTDLLIFTDGGWPYVINGYGQQWLEFPCPPNAVQDWGEVPGRPDDYGYGYYVRVANFYGDKKPEILISDRRFVWLYTIKEIDAVDVPPRSDGQLLNADLENYVDGVIQTVNAGVRWLGNPYSKLKQGTVEITKDDAFFGSRAAHIHSKELDEIARVKLQKRFDAPEITGDTVAEVVFRPVSDKATDIDDLVVWQAASSSKRNVGLVLLANGKVSEGTYRLDVLQADSSTTGEIKRVNGVVKELKQNDWIRIIQYRKSKEGLVELWIGLPGQEKKIGQYHDLSPEDDYFSVEVGDTDTSERRGSGYWDDFRIGGTLVKGQTVASPEPPLRDVSKELPVIETPITVGREKQLFIDDVVIESMQGLTQTLHPVEKHPANPLLVPDKPWEGTAVLIYGAVYWDQALEKFRMWYLAWGKHVGQPTFVCYAESTDGLQWVKPELGLYEFNGSKNNNIVITGVKSNTVVIYDPRDPDESRRFKAVIRGGGTRGYLSPDGIHWRDAGVLLGQCYDSTSVHWDPVDQKWMASVKIFRDGKRARGYAESKDFFHWSDTYFMATVDDRDMPDDEIYSMSIKRYESVYLGLLRMYDTKKDMVDIELAVSRNAKHWQRPFRTPLIPTSKVKGTWDYGNNSAANNAPIQVGDELWFYYSGRSTTHEERPNTGSIGLGTLRVDGFVSVDADQTEGILTTKPLQFKNKNLYVNADASKGQVRAELIDASGKVIESFSLSNCEPITSDSIRYLLQWQGVTSMKLLGDRKVRLRFYIGNAKLYAFWTE